MQVVPLRIILVGLLPLLRTVVAGSPSSYSVQLPQLLLQSMVFLGNASFGRTGQIELNNPVQSTSAGSTPTDSNGRALYNLPIKLINPVSNFYTSFTFATLDPSSVSFVIAPNNQDLVTSYGFSVRLATTNNSVTVWSGSRVLAAANSDVNIGQDSRRTFVWITYSAKLLRLDVKVNNLSAVPSTSLISLRMDSATVFNQFMFVGFSASASMTSSKTTIYSWNFTSWLFNPVGHPDPASVSVIASKRARNLVVAGLAVAALVVAISASVLIIRHVRSSSTTAKMSKSLSKTEKDESLSFLRRFSFKELVSATNNFDLNNRLGACPNVSQCYRGVLPDCMVAVKIVSQTDPLLVQENWKLVSDFASLRHRNLINLLGYCSSNSTSKSMLVYEFVPNGSLDEHLFSKAPGHPTLPWSHRHKAALGLAQALEYLHSRGLVHGNVKSSNVLLDSNFTARLGDYSLKNRMGSKNQPVAGTIIVAGTFGYVAPEAVQTGRPTAQADVFAFGAVLLELVCGRRALEAEGGGVGDDDECVTVLVERVWELLKEERFEVVVDSKLGTLYDVSEMEAMVSVGLACSDYDPERRPSMDVALKMLTGEVGLPSLKGLTERKGRYGEEMKTNKKQEESDTQKTIEELLAMKNFGSLFN